jgi:SAM-dependent methyltransferase
MTLEPSAVEQMYSRRADSYRAFVGFFRSRSGLRAVLARIGAARPGLRVLDAGCGFGLASFALCDLLRERGLDYERIDAFDLTPAMLARFQRAIDAHGMPRVTLHRADVLEEAGLPAGWQGYDLVLCASMLEYLPERELVRALRLLRARMAPGARIVAMITRRSWETKLLIDWLWHAQRYGRRTLVGAFVAAGFGTPRFVRFPWRYGWLNRANHVVLAENPGETLSEGGASSRS